MVKDLYDIWNIIHPCCLFKVVNVKGAEHALDCPELKDRLEEFLGEASVSVNTGPNQTGIYYLY